MFREGLGLVLLALLLPLPLPLPLPMLRPPLLLLLLLLPAKLKGAAVAEGSLRPLMMKVVRSSFLSHCRATAEGMPPPSLPLPLPLTLLLLPLPPPLMPSSRRLCSSLSRGCGGEGARP